jgi:hypothetical protein
MKKKKIAQRFTVNLDSETLNNFSFFLMYYSKAPGSGQLHHQPVQPVKTNRYFQQHFPIRYPFPPSGIPSLHSPSISQMPLCLLPNRLLPLPYCPLITCHASPAALRSSPSSPPPTLPNLLNNTTPVPSLSCALQCPHFQSYAPFP